MCSRWLKYVIIIIDYIIYMIILLIKQNIIIDISLSYLNKKNILIFGF
jgi:hypothetical protein